ncbi:MAG: bifunctional DNA-formamidopyrimidine glycosylase/DNA-(apurinic or apyrimidinic site) lyase [Candidatus Pacebacteria bacterium]|nr:bifunctional DNA-formamidopyrimidine glycosylase/DNA-(apurinic or apyrimidinic site) lyase [Candidatus Paceibacterota bacterium]MCF7862431.1 bifunctional DNA-formamidopyrimidine glycosylase/DNA-(apurinic or apyrimidinic site) lyase [Candidatus Paceibacterota bacterium]
MPELPEVETTTKGLRVEVVGLKILDVWTDLKTKDKRKADTVANPRHFPLFKKEILNTKILQAERRAKNILLHLSNKKSILIHLKMTGHLLYGTYVFVPNENKWIPKSQNIKNINYEKEGALSDPFNRFVHVVFSLSNGKHLAFSDMRKFGKITLLETEKLYQSKHLKNLGPEPLEKSFISKTLKVCLSKRPTGKIKTVLMDQSVLVGVGNIYSDEILFHANIHPEKIVSKLSDTEIKNIHTWMQKILKKGIDFGGDSMSDYRNIYGLPGKFQMHHKAYRRTGQKCLLKNCSGIIHRKVINGRSAHFCNLHQK